MISFLIAVIMVLLMIRLADREPQIATVIMGALYIGFVIYSLNLADRQMNRADRNLLKKTEGRKIYYGMIVGK